MVQSTPPATAPLIENDPSKSTTQVEVAAVTPQDGSIQTSTGSDRKRPQGVHWPAPTLMTCAFALGIVFAVCHHVLYQKLDGEYLDQSVLGQTWAVR